MSKARRVAELLHSRAMKHADPRKYSYSFQNPKPHQPALPQSQQRQRFLWHLGNCVIQPSLGIPESNNVLVCSQGMLHIYEALEVAESQKAPDQKSGTAMGFSRVSSSLIFGVGFFFFGGGGGEVGGLLLNDKKSLIFHI